MRIGVRIREARKSRGFTQKELAEQIGVHQTTVGEWERGEKRIPEERIDQIAQVLYVKASWLREAVQPEKPCRGADKRPRQVSRTYCAGCFHFCISGMQTHCDYIGNTGHCRPCPAGEGCTERITPAEWRKKNESVRVEFNGYYPELRQKRDTGEK